MIVVPMVARREKFMSAKPAELISSLPAAAYSVGSERQWRRVAHVLVPDCVVGEELECFGTFQITNDLGYIVEFVACLILTPQASGTAGVENLTSVSDGQEPTYGRFITPANGYNVTPNQCEKFPHGGMHHAPSPPLYESFTVPDGFGGDQYVAIIAYVDGSLPWPTSESVRVEPMSAFVTVIR